jgi:signal transduction histidine kinase
MLDTTRLLMVDDDPVDLELTKRLLSKAIRRRFQVDSAQRLNEAVEMVRSHKYDVILLDLNLPGSHGIVTLEAIRRVNDQLPIIVLSGLSDEETALRSLDYGAQDYLVKGQVTSDTLANAIRYAMQRQQLLQEIKSAKELLEKKNRRLAEMYETAHRFVDNVSHEFRTPLTVIKEYTSLMRDGLVGAITGDQGRLLDVVNDRADDLNTMVDDMLDVGKLETGKLGVWRRACAVADIVEGLRPSLERKATIKGVTFTIEVDEDLPEIYCDDEKVGRVIINLTVNAIKFCREGGLVRVAATRDPRSSGVLIAVMDNGPGIDAAHREEIFERFKQLNTNVRSSCKGFGLGLNIAKELVDLNFGEMDLQSTVGRGSTFTFTLPPARPAEVLRRYIHRVKHLSDGAQQVSAITACVDEVSGAQAGGDVDWYLNRLLRRNDLVFRLDSCHWLLIIAANKDELGHFLDAATTTRRDIDRNRPQGPLPAIEMQPAGTWQLDDGDSNLWTALCACVEPREATHA